MLFTQDKELHKLEQSCVFKKANIYWLEFLKAFIIQML